MSGRSKTKINPDSYIYASARVRASDTDAFSVERCERLSETKTYAELLRFLEEAGLRDNGDDCEAALAAYVRHAFDEVTAMVPDPGLYDIFRYQYDCQNYKAALKARIREMEPDDVNRLMFPLGTVPCERVYAAVCSGDGSSLPPCMAKAFDRAAEAYAATSDPQLIDVLLDRGCFEDMKATADKYNCEFFSDYVTVREDTLNILTAIRLLRMNGAHINYGYFLSMALPFGELGADFFTAPFNTGGADGEALLLERLGSTRYARIAGRISGEKASLSRAEKACEEYSLGFAAAVKHVLYGPEVPAAYLIKLECDVKNLRIVIAGRRADLHPENIRERLRFFTA